MDIEKLIEQLNDFNENHISVLCGSGQCACGYLCDKDDCIVVRAATALSTLQEENEKLRVLSELGNMRAKDYRVMRDRAVKAEDENEKLRAELERAKEERDSAISDMTYIARTYPVDLCDYLVCQYCKHYPNANTGCPGWTENDCFEWRSQKED